MRTLTLIVSFLFLAPIWAACAPSESEQAGKTRRVVVREDASRPGGLTFRSVEMTAAEAGKAESTPGVVAVIPDRKIEVPPLPGPHVGGQPKTPLFPPFSRGDEKGVAGETLPVQRLPLTPATWFAKDVHRAPAAWAAGYTGAGVKVAIIDEGIDFGHPDLEGCQARVTNPDSPYFGWPIAFDPPAMGYYAATGYALGGYVDTSAIILEGDTSHGIVLPGTSKSGVYHIGEHNSYWLRFIIGRWGTAPAVLVADEKVAGVYDTVYVDINKDLDFRNDKPCRLGDEVSWWDADGDGLADFSAGMVYFIADGINPIPASDWLYNLPAPANGSMVAFAGSFGKFDAHGTLVASAIAAQGKVGRTYGVPQKPPETGGMVYGMAPGAGIIQVGSIFESYADLYNAILFAAVGYDGVPGTGDEADIINMSFSASSADDDGWDFLSRYITYLNHAIVPSTTFVAASGNGGPGYGTVSSPGGASSAVTVGAATLYGSTDVFDPIETVEQVLFGDVQQWSNRGPSSLGQVKPEVTAVGAWATGAIPVYGSGEHAWAVWAGTSLSAPITAGVLALIYEAYGSRFGVFPHHEEARAILMSGAQDLSYNVFEQGAGMIDAVRSTEIASGTGGIIVRPSSWQAGARQGAPAAFPQVIKPGESSVRDFAIQNTGSKPLKLSLAGQRLLQTGGTAFEVDTNIQNEDIEAMMSRPDYLIDLTDRVPADTDLLRIRLSFPYDNFSLTDPALRRLMPSSLWLVSLYDWTDLNRDGRVWEDFNANGAVNQGEFQEGEVNRFMFTLPWSTVIELSAKRPMERKHDGLLLGLHHALKSEEIPVTRFKIELEFYRQVAWDWLSVPSRPVVVAPGQTTRIPVKLQSPRSATPGLYAGSLIVLDEAGERVTVPISAAVAGQGGAVWMKPPLVSGSDGFRDTYDNGRFFPAFDWGWRSESGDWRFYFVDVPARRPEAATFVLANASWRDMPADTDIMIYRPEREDVFSQMMPDVFGPYGLPRSGSSRRTNNVSGMWPFETATGGPSEWVAGESRPGLNLVQLHNVLASGNEGSQPIELSAGQVWLEPGKLELTPGQSSAVVSFTSSMPLPGLSGLAFGFAVPQDLTGQWIDQEALQVPSSSRWRRDITLAEAGLLEISVDSTDDIDIDLYLLHDADGDGHFDWTYEVVAISGSPTAAEKIRYVLPKAGSYRIAVHGYRVPQPSRFDIRILAVERQDIVLSLPNGAIQHNRPTPITITFPPAPPGGVGMLFVGPPEAPGVIPLPVRVRG